MSAIKFISLGVEAFVLAAMKLLIYLSPVVCMALSGQVKFVHRYFRTVSKSKTCLLALKRTHVISRNVERKLANNNKKLEIIEGFCTHCGLCCIDRSCVFLNIDEANNSSCTIYNNWFWKLTSCASYPIDSQSIDVYGCPSFNAIPIKLER
jgi:TPP-dependent indolepyruvate ferredoxin oxidoreductase alpha subunit